MSEQNEHALEQRDGEALLAYTTGAIRALELYELNNELRLQTGADVDLAEAAAA